MEHSDVPMLSAKQDPRNKEDKGGALPDNQTAFSCLGNALNSLKAYLATAIPIMMKTYHIQLSLGPLTLGSPFYWVKQIAGLTTFFFYLERILLTV